MRLRGTGYRHSKVHLNAWLRRWRRSRLFQTLDSPYTERQQAGMGILISHQVHCLYNRVFPVDECVFSPAPLGQGTGPGPDYR